MSEQFYTHGFSPPLSDDSWLITQKEYSPDFNQVYETNFALVNGYMGSRGTLEEGGQPSRPGTFIAGVFNQAEDVTKALVNTPNWLPLRLSVNGRSLNLSSCEIISCKRALDMQTAVLHKSIILKDAQGRETHLEGFRFLSRHNVHRAGIRLYVTALNYSDTLMVESITDGTITNIVEDQGASYEVKHLRLVENGAGYLEMGTRDADVRIGVGTAVTAYTTDDKKITAPHTFSASGEQTLECLELELTQGQPICIDKHAVTYTSRDVDPLNLKSAVTQELVQFVADGLSLECEAHMQTYRRLWETADVVIEGDPHAQKILRFNIFHLMSTVNAHDATVNMGAKGLHGEGYRGHIFWDTEVYLLPFFSYTWPEAARTLLLYRYHLLDDARENAAINGQKGARFAWESTDTGHEVCVKWCKDIMGQKIRCWCGEIEIFVSSAVAFGIYEYFRITNDIDFMLDHGIEIMVETARYWASACTYNAAQDRYDIPDVIGPDEFHSHVDNNFYTNYFARWNIAKAFELLDVLRRDYPTRHQALLTQLALTETELAHLAEVQAKITILFDPETKLAEQFEGYFEREEHLITAFDENRMPLWPEGITEHAHIENTQLIKQPDVVMAMLLLSEEFDDETKRLNYEFYKPRTTHKSSLSASASALMGLKVGDTAEAYQSFLRTAETDLVDNQGNAYQGLHLASTGGTWQVAILGFAGMFVDGDGFLCFAPNLPAHWQQMAFKVWWRGTLLTVVIDQQTVHLQGFEGDAAALQIRVGEVA